MDIRAHGQACLIFWMFWTIQTVYASVFFHEPSQVVLLPNSSTKHETFGFSLGYQGGPTPHLVSGAPLSSFIGNVFRCPMESVLVNKSAICGDVDLEVQKLAPYPKEFASNLHLNLGASIAATKDYFLTCAPLWPDLPYDNEETGWLKFAYGTCFVYDKSPHRYKGMFEKYLDPETSPAIRAMLIGGTGWKTYMDEKRDLLLIGKVSLYGDVISLNASNPLAQAESVALANKNGDTLYYNDVTHVRSLGYSITSGNFFGHETFYAVTALEPANVTGAIYFLYDKIDEEGRKLHLKKQSRQPIHISDKSVGAMFGAALCGADLNNDGLSELIVGAPAMDDGVGGFETGAVHIYLGGSMETINEESRRRLIVGTKDGSRFGATIAANDIDGDWLPEIFVSAPYEDLGVGAVYILSGFEINEVLLKQTGFRQVTLTSLRGTQRIQSKSFHNFGYSLQVIPDMDANGCDELAIGAPGSANIALLRCLPAINVTVNTELVGVEVVKEQDKDFTVKVCINVKSVKEKFSAQFTVTNAVIGKGAYLKDQISYTVPVTDNKEGERCTNIIVTLADNEPGEYRFTSKIELDLDPILNSNDFDTKWVTLSQYCKTESSLMVSRHCTGKDCEPNLSMNLTWVDIPSDSSYQLGSSDSITAVLRVDNQGNSSFDSCVWLRVDGAPVSQIGCVSDSGGYKCYMPKPLRRYKNHEINIKLNMSQPTSNQKRILIEASLFDYCSQTNTSKKDTWQLQLKLDPNEVVLNGIHHNQTVSDAEIADPKVQSIYDAQEYLITNKGSVMWKQIKAVVSIHKRPFIKSYKVSSINTPKRVENEDRIDFVYLLDLNPRSVIKLIATTEIAKDKIMENLVDGKLVVNSSFSVSLKSDLKKLKTNMETVITMHKDLSLGQNMAMIIVLAIFGAIIVFALVVFILYKIGFFKRNEKTKLESLKQEHIRRMSVKHSTSTSHDHGGLPCLEENLDLEVDDDPFEVVEMTEPVLKEDEKKEK